MIDIHGATRRYGELVAVDHVDVSIGRGQIVGLLGHNGAGKTTLMKMLTGYLEPSDGTLSVAGHDVVHERTLAQHKLGYLPEAAPAYGEMTVQDYLVTMAELRGVDRAQLPRAVARAVVRTGLQERLHQPIRTLSKGFRQRVGLAQAIVHEPQVLILDEPTNGLDPEQILAIRELVRELAKDATVLLSTHILQEVEAVCDRVLVMAGGKLVADASLHDLLRSDQLVVWTDADADQLLADVEGVAEVHEVEPDAHAPGVRRWLVSCEGPPSGKPILDALTAAGAPVYGLAPRTRSLESALRDLQAKGVAA
jgi:ABC-2 type transport system ATP-binding protein